jgi:3-dehydroquinate synthase
MDAVEIVSATKSDKKMEGDHVKFILLDGLGCAKIYKDVTDDEMLRAIASLQE